MFLFLKYLHIPKGYQTQIFGDRLLDHTENNSALLTAKTRCGLCLENYSALPPICQFNVEVHYAPDKDPDLYKSFIEFFPRFIRAGQFLLMNVELPDKKKYRHLRMFFFNVGNEQCIRRFIF